jgi:hypothetical protein
MKKRESKKQIAIQKRIEEVMNQEFEKLIAESGDDPLLKLIRQGKIDSLSLEEIKTYLGGKKDG